MSDVASKLLSKLTGETERVGYILKSGEIVEVENVCPEPKEGFEVKGEDILKYEADAVASWHTHPGMTSNLSANDYETFLEWPSLDHFIVGTDGVTKYVVQDDEVLISDA
jgi:proteasome lid subunit RPN8/RPN11